MSVIKNKQVLLAARPDGTPKPSDFNIVETDLREPGDGEFLCRIIYLSLDPYMRGRMDAAKSYAASVELGEVMGGGTVGEVIKSNNPKYQVGDYVLGMFGWQSHAISDGELVRKLDPAEAPISTAVGVLGMPGLTAYVGLLDIGELKEGETVVVSAASGAVGSVVGQIARIKGCRTVGVAGSSEKCAYVKDELGFDACVSHYSDTLDEDIAKECPDGIDVYYENVGGKTFDAVLPLMNVHGRIPVCGRIATYNMGGVSGTIGAPEGPDKSVKVFGNILTKRLKVQGFIILDHYHRQNAFLKDVSSWIRSGELKYREDIVEGLDNAPEAFIGLLAGKNFGKQLIRVSDDPTR